MHRKIQICTFNCHSFIANIDVVRDLCTDNDIILLQETFLTDESSIETYIGNQFSFFSVPAETEYFSGRPKGGLLILWRSNLDSHVKRVACNNSRINGVKLVSHSDEFLIFNIYTPYENNTVDNYNAYIELMSCLGDLIHFNYAPNINVLLAGDFNASPNGGRFWNELQEFSNELQFNIAELQLGNDTFTFLSPVHNTTSWLDHVIESRPGLVSDISVQYDSVLYDHFPITFTVNFQFDNCQNDPPVEINTPQSIKCVPWERLNGIDKGKYEVNTEIKFCETFWGHLFQCPNLSNCKNEECKRNLDIAYKFLTENLLKCSDEFTRKKVKRKNKVVPGWNDYCKDVHKIARTSFLEWRAAGKPRSGHSLEIMKNTRLNFKNALQNCKNNEINLRNSKVKQCFAQKSRTAFWKELKSKNSSNKFSEIDSVRGNSNIANIFKLKYETVYNDENCSTEPPGYECEMNNYFESTDQSFSNISEAEVINAIQRLNPGASHDHVHSNHLKFCGLSVVTFLKCFYNSIILHSYIPPSLLTGLINPRVKNKFGHLNESNNYRPVMTSSVILKCLELCHGYVPTLI